MPLDNRNLALKLEISRILLRKALREYGPDKVCVACSGGKDSMLISELYRRTVKEMYPTTSALILHSDTHIQPKGTIEFIREYCEANNCSLVVAEPKTTFGKIVRQYGLPRVRLQKDHKEPECCKYLKNEPADELYKEMGIRAIIIGLTKEESHNRRMFAGRCGDYYYAKIKDRRQVYPILEYSEKEIWEAHAMLGLCHHPFYDQCPGHRLGCLPCTSYLSWQKRMPIESPKWYEWVRKRRNQELLIPIENKANQCMASQISPH